MLDANMSQCRDTHTVESFNHMMLTYVPKRIHFSTRTFKMRMNLALLDWVSVLCTDEVYNAFISCRMRMSIRLIPANGEWLIYSSQIGTLR